MTPTAVSTFYSLIARIASLDLGKNDVVLGSNPPLAAPAFRPNPRTVFSSNDFPGCRDVVRGQLRSPKDVQIGSVVGEGK